jgi:DNA-binding MarR family transcriptional regulator
MKLQKTLARLATASDDPTELRRVARALASELPRERVEVLRGVRAGLARSPLPEKSFAAGYVAGMLDVATEYEGQVRAEADHDARHELASGTGAHAVLATLAAHAARPGEIAAALGCEPAEIAQTLDELSTAGLVQPFAVQAEERHMRPYRLTLDGRRVLEAQAPGLAAQIEIGIRIAVGMFDYLCRHEASPASALQEIAEEILHDPDAAALAVRAWAEEARDSGLVTESEIPPATPRFGQAREDEVYYVPPRRKPVEDGRTEQLWQHAPVLLAQLEARRQARVPVYVRTNASGWSAWAYALQSQDETGLSRTILDGDIMTRAISPPDQRFDLVYDNREALEADRDEPTMRAFLERADAKFLVATQEDEVPEGFTLLAPSLDDEAGSN